jgi:hypothetical protein
MHGIRRQGGQLDVDMNAGFSRLTNTPVENIFYSSMADVRPGRYHLYVNQYNMRSSDNVGFEVEVDFNGETMHFAYDQPVRGNVTVLAFEITRQGEFNMQRGLASSVASRKLCNIDTQQFHKVNAMMLSPNFWADSTIGNKHYFFMLDGCVNDGTARGIYNEFLHSNLDGHRKVFELIGSKIRAASAAEQLSGLGFSSTQRNHAMVRVTGAHERTLKINF